MEKVFAIAMRVTVPVSALFTLCTALFPTLNMRLFTTDAVLISAGAKYLRLASGSYLFCGISQIYLCVMKNIGHAKTSTVISSVCVVFDAIMNAVLIFGLFGLPQMSITGAAVSTTIARFVEMCWCILFLPKAKTVNLRSHFIWHPDKRLHKDFWKYTTSVLGNELVWGIGFTMYTIIMGHLNSDAVAANSITGITKNVVICFCMGLGSGGGILVGNELGAGRLARAKEYGAKLCRASIVSGLATGLIAAFVLKLPVIVVYCIVNADELLKLPAVLRHYKKYLWVKDLTAKENEL